MSTLDEIVPESLAAYKADQRVSRRIKSIYPEGVPGDVVDAVGGKLGASLPQCRNLNPRRG